MFQELALVAITMMLEAINATLVVNCLTQSLWSIQNALFALQHQSWDSQNTFTSIYLKSSQLLSSGSRKHPKKDNGVRIQLLLVRLGWTRDFRKDALQEI